MKMKTRLLLAASVFFMLAMLIGCGIPTLFWISTDISYEESTKEVTINITDSTSLGLLDMNKHDPSLMLAYVVSSPAFDDDKARVAIPNAFNAEFMKGYYGKHISSNSTEILSLDDEELTLYLFSDSTNKIFSAPYYHASAKDQSKIKTVFTIELIEDPIDSGNFNFKVSSNDYDFLIDINNLIQFDGTPFEYEANTSTRIYLYCALNCSEGKFNNIYWSKLKYLTTLDLPPSQL